jgi:hypothetical protein
VVRAAGKGFKALFGHKFQRILNLLLKLNHLTSMFGGLYAGTSKLSTDNDVTLPCANGVQARSGSIGGCLDGNTSAPAVPTALNCEGVTCVGNLRFLQQFILQENISWIRIFLGIALTTSARATSIALRIRTAPHEYQIG